MQRHLFSMLVVFILHSSFFILNFSTAAQAAVLTDNGNGTVTDSKTGLIWQQGEPGVKTWGNAISYCEGLSLGGQNDWRLPNIKELESLTDDARYNPAIDRTYFPSAIASYYWSSTTYAFNPSYAWGVYFGVGYVDYYNKNGGLYVRCVRGGQSGSLGSLSISFSVIPAQSINIPFNVTVSANGAGQTGRVQLYLASGNRLNPTSVDLSNGRWSGDLTVSSPEADARIVGSGLGYYGSSNPFAVSDPVNPNRVGGITGKVLARTTNNPIVGANVTLNRVGILNIRSAVTGTDGSYQFGSIPPGSYYLAATITTTDSTPQTYRTSTLPFDVKDGVCQTINVDLRLSSKPPVLVIPGIMGSTRKNASDLSLYPDLSDGDNPSDKLKILNPLTITGKPVGLDKLIDTLKTDFDVIPVPWDWRMDTDKAVDEYLIKKIAQVKDEYGVTKVDVVAHSTGGLLTRAYIQGSGYDQKQDIDRFIMVATPNQGSANPYWLLEGGDPKTIDDLTEPWYLEGINFYSHTANNLYKAENRGQTAFKTCLETSWRSLDALKRCLAGSPIEGLDFNAPRKDKPFMRDFLERKVPGGKNLMASYEPFIEGKSGSEMNKWLYDLNKDSSGMAKMVPIWEQTPADKVGTALLLSDNVQTFHTVNVDSNNTSLYRYGQPRSSQTKVPGDGTVPADEASSPFYLVASMIPAGSHAGLLGAFKDEIKNLLCRPPRSCVQAASASRVMALAASAVASSPTLSISINGRVQPYLVASNGTNGVNPVNGTFSETIPLSNTVITSQGALVEITSPVDGIYQLSLKGQFDDVYDISFYYNDGATIESKQIRGVHHNAVTTLTFTLSGSASTKLNLTIPVAPPTNVTATNNATNARITWTASTDLAVSGYDIYARRFDQPSFNLLASTAATIFDTGHAWNSGGTGVEWSYLVIARKGAAESFFDLAVENRDYMVANFTADKTSGDTPLTVTFTDNSTGTVTGRQWDFNGDGVVDSTETSPVYTYTTPGAYSVTLTVTGPDGSDQQTRIGYVVVNGVAVTVNGVCGDAIRTPSGLVPAANLCNAGNTSIVNVSGLMWSWSCGGINGGTTASCTTPISKTMIGANGYDTLNIAYTNAVSGSTIQALNTLFVEDLNMNGGKIITLKGGYLPGYGSQSELPTTIKGKLTINNGSLRVDRVKVE